MTRTPAEVEKLIADNIGLAVSESMRWGRDIEADERMACGMRGLARACQDWNPKRARLSTLASWWVRAECTRYRRAIVEQCPRERPNTDCVVAGFKESTVIEVAGDPASPCPVKEMTRADIQAQVDSLLALLTDHDRRVVTMRFGIGCEPATYQKIADEYGASHTSAINDLNRIMLFLRRAVAIRGMECAA